MSNGALDNLISDAQGELAYHLERLYDQCEGTPIERAFETALHSVIDIAPVAGFDMKLFKMPAGSLLTDMPDDKPKAMIGNTWYWTQYQFFPDWRVDFVLGAVNHAKGRTYLVVECDGHDFHERTKEQAEKDRSRDRRLQDAGYRIYRFTGREIYREARECATQALLSVAGLRRRDEEGGRS